MKRTQVFLPDQLIRKLEKTKEEKGLSKGEIIRRALESFFKKKEWENDTINFLVARYPNVYSLSDLLRSL